MKKYFSISIGQNGIHIKLNFGTKIVESVYSNEYNQEFEEKIIPLLKNNPRCKIHIFLDNIGQNYTRKKFPNLNFIDLQKIVSRKFNFEIPKTDLRIKIFIGKSKKTKEYEYLFVSSAIDESLKYILDLVDKVPNVISGIYMVPLEMQNFIKDLTAKLNTDSKGKKLKESKPAKWTLFLIENEISNIRQIAFKNNKIVFTRFLYITDQSTDIRTKKVAFENDISRTVGFIKRFALDFNNKDLQIITITKEASKNLFSSINLGDLKLIALTPYEANKILYPKQNDIVYSEEYADDIVKKYIVNSYRAKKFLTPQLGQMNKIVKYFTYTKFLLIIAICYFLYLFIVFSVIIFRDKIILNKLKNDFQTQQTEYEKSAKKSVLINSSNINTIIETGYIYDFIKINNYDPFENISDIYSNIPHNYLKINSISWNLQRFDIKNIKDKIKFKYSLNLETKLLNTTGAIDTLLENYNNTKKLLNTNNFNQKYKITHIDEIQKQNIKVKELYNYPIKINIEEK